MALTYTQEEIDVCIQEINCLVACNGVKLSIASKKGDLKAYNTRLQNIPILDNVVEALLCYDPNSTTNFLTAEEIQNLISLGYGLGNS